MSNIKNIIDGSN